MYAIRTDKNKTADVIERAETAAAFYAQMGSMMAQKRFLKLIETPMATRFGQQDALWRTVAKDWRGHASQLQGVSAESESAALVAGTAESLKQMAERIAAHYCGKTSSSRFTVTKGVCFVNAANKAFDLDETVRQNGFVARSSLGLTDITFHGRNIAYETAKMLQSLTTLLHPTGSEVFEAVAPWLFRQPDTFWLKGYPADLLCHAAMTLKDTPSGRWLLDLDCASTHVIRGNTQANIPGTQDNLELAFEERRLTAAGQSALLILEQRQPNAADADFNVDSGCRLA